MFIFLCRILVPLLLISSSTVFALSAVTNPINSTYNTAADFSTNTYNTAADFSTNAFDATASALSNAELVTQHSIVDFGNATASALTNAESFAQNAIIDFGNATASTMTQAGLAAQSDLTNAGFAAEADLTHAGFAAQSDITNAGFAAEADLTNAGRAAQSDLTNAGVAAAADAINAGRAAAADIINVGSAAQSDITNAASAAFNSLDTHNSEASRDLSNATDSAASDASAHISNSGSELMHGNIGAGLTELGAAAFDPLADLGAGVGGAAVAVGTGVGGAAIGMGRGAGAAAVGVGTGVGNAAVAVGTGVGGAAVGIGRGVSSAAISVTSGVANAASDATSGVRNAALDATSGVANAAGAATSGVRNAALDIASGVSTAAAPLINDGTIAYNFIAPSIATGVTTVIDAAPGIANTAYTGSVSAVNAAIDAAPGIANTAYTGSVSAVNAAIDAAPGITNAALDGTVMAGTAALGGTVMVGNATASAMTDAGNATARAMTDAGNATASALTDAGNATAGAMTVAGGAIGSALQSAGQTIGGNLSTAGRAIYDALGLAQINSAVANSAVAAAGVFMNSASVANAQLSNAASAANASVSAGANRASSDLTNASASAAASITNARTVAQSDVTNAASAASNSLSTRNSQASRDLSNATDSAASDASAHISEAGSELMEGDVGAGLTHLGAAAFDPLADLGTGVGDATASVATGVGEAAAAVGTGVGNATVAMATGVGDATVAMGTGVGDAAVDVSTGVAQAAGDVGGGVVQAAGGIVGGVESSVITLAPGVSATAQDVGVRIADTSLALGEQGYNIAYNTLSEPITIGTDYVMEGTNYVVEGVNFLNETFAISTAAGDIGRAASDARRDLEASFASAGSDMTNAIAGDAANIVNSAYTAEADLMGGADQALGNLSSGVSQASSQVNDSISSASNDVNNSISSASADVNQSISSANRDLSNALSSAASHSSAHISASGSELMEGNIGAGLTDLGAAAFDPLMDLGSGAVSAAGSVATAAVNAAGSVATGAVNAAGSVATGAVGAAATLTYSGINAAGTLAQSAGAAAVAVGGAVGNTVRDVASGVTTAAGDIAQGALNAANDMTQGVVNAAEDVASSVANSVLACLRNPCNCGWGTRYEYWNGTTNSYDQNYNCPPWNKTAGRDGCLLQFDFPDRGDMAYHKVCAEVSPQNDYFIPSIQIRVQTCNIACWTYKDTLTGDGECTNYPGPYGIPTMRICARVAMPYNTVLQQPADPGYMFRHHLDFEGAVVPDKPMTAPDGSIVYMDKPKVCAYWDPSLYDSLQNVLTFGQFQTSMAASAVYDGGSSSNDVASRLMDPDFMDTDPLRQPIHDVGAMNGVFQFLANYYEVQGNMHASAAEAAQGLANSRTQHAAETDGDNAVGGLSQFGDTMAAGFAQDVAWIEWLGSKVDGVVLYNVMKTLGTLNRIVIASLGCTEMTLGPYPPPYCPSLVLSAPKPKVFQICPTVLSGDGTGTLTPVSTSNNICVNSSVTNNIVSNAVRVAFTNFVSLCASGHTPGDACVSISGGNISPQYVHRATNNLDILPICTSTSMGLCVESPFYAARCQDDPAWCSQGVRVVYGTSNGPTTYFNTGVPDCSPLLTTGCQKIWGIDVGAFADIPLAFPLVESTNTTADLLSSSVTLRDALGNSESFVARITRTTKSFGSNSKQDPTEICVFYADNFPAHAVAVGCVSRPPVPEPVVYGCNSPSIHTTCTSTYMAPQMVARLQVGSNTTEGVLGTAVNYQNINLAGFNYGTFATDDNFTVKPFSGTHSINPTSIYGNYKDGRAPYATSGANMGNPTNAVYLNGLEYLNGKYIIGGQYLCLSGYIPIDCATGATNYNCVLTSLLHSDVIPCVDFTNDVLVQYPGINVCTTDTSSCSNLNTIRVANQSITILNCGTITAPKLCYDYGTPTPLCQIAYDLNDRICPPPSVGQVISSNDPLDYFNYSNGPRSLNTQNLQGALALSYPGIAACTQNQTTNTCANTRNLTLYNSSIAILNCGTSAAPRYCYVDNTPSPTGTAQCPASAGPANVNANTQAVRNKTPVEQGLCVEIPQPAGCGVIDSTGASANGYATWTAAAAGMPSTGQCIPGAHPTTPAHPLQRNCLIDRTTGIASLEPVATGGGCTPVCSFTIGNVTLDGAPFASVSNYNVSAITHNGTGTVTIGIFSGAVSSTGTFNIPITYYPGLSGATFKVTSFGFGAWDMVHASISFKVNNVQFFGDSNPFPQASAVHPGGWTVGGAVTGRDYNVIPFTLSPGISNLSIGLNTQFSPNYIGFTINLECNP